MKVVNRPLTPQFIIFETLFSKFGTFICFDVLFHDPAVPLVTQHNIDHVVFPTAWFDALPLFAAIGFQGSWARGMGVNFLAANTHVPEVLSTGSGIFSPSGTKNTSGACLPTVLSPLPLCQKYQRAGQVICLW